MLSAEHPAVVLLQPRRVAARAAAGRIAEERGWRLGGEVGYHIRFENRVGPQTRVRVLTEGILMRQILANPFLEGIGCVILDEFHERSIHTDVALALLREIQSSVREDLRIVVMSATMETAGIAAFLGDAPVHQSAGRMYPVEISWQEREDRSPVWERAAASVRRVTSERGAAGHVLVFLPGIGEIRRTQSLLGDLGDPIHVLHSSVSSEDQDAALRPTDRRKIILATNIAETSLTIDGVTTVIDSGLARVMVQDRRLGIDRLELRRISLASATQRAGRAGRTAPGRCVRMWTRSEEAGMPPADLPEVHRIDLAATVLGLKCYGLRDVRSLRWFEAPAADSIERAERLLAMLGATNADGSLTPLGRAMGDLPLHPRLARLLLAGGAMGLAREAATMAALLSERDILSRRPGRRRAAKWEGDSDLIDRLDIVDDPASSDDVDRAAMATLRRVRDELQRQATGAQKSLARGTESWPRDRKLRALPLHAFPDRVAVRRAADASKGVMVGGRGVVLDPESTARQGALFLCIDARDAPGAELAVNIASGIEEESLGVVFPDLYENRRGARFDPEREKMIAIREVRFAGLVLRDDPTGGAVDREAAAEALARHLEENLDAFLREDDSAARFLARVRFLAAAQSELDLPAFEGETLATGLREACDGHTSLAAVRKQGLRAALEARLTYKQRAALDAGAPEALPVPSGNRIKLTYGDDGPPFLAVRLQELFGLAETPRIADGRVPVVMHLLGPNYRPVQVTGDLRSFWNGVYQEVRKELRARYPKHPWPEDPWNAPPVSVGRRRH